MDKIFIKDLKLKASIGIYDKEKKKKQRIILNMVGTLHSSCRGHITDHIDDTVSYEVFLDEATALAQNRHFDLAEHFVDTLAHNILKKTRLSEIEITLEKPDILKKHAKSVGVTIKRSSNL